MSMKKKEVWKVKGAKEGKSLTFSIAFVEEPANMTDFVYFGNIIKLAIESDEKRLVTGLVLRPEQLINRYSEKLNREYDLVFDKEEIRHLMYNFQKNGYQNNSNLHHNDNLILDGVTFVENWIVEDVNNDKGNIRLSDIKEGDWLTTAYVENDDLWERIKSGEVKGFSIEAFIDMEKIDMGVYRTQEETDNKKNKKEMNLLKFFKNLIKLSTINTDLGELTCDAFEVGNIVYQADGEILADSEFVYEEKTYKTDVEGKITEIVDVVVEDMVEEPVDAPVEDKPVDEVSVEEQIAEEAVAEVESVDVPAEVPVDWELVAKELTKKLEELMASNEELSKKVEEFGKLPAAQKFSSNAVPLAKETYMERLNRIAREQ